MQESFHEQLLIDLLACAFGALDADTLALLRAQLRWVQLAAGQTLMHQGEPGDALYLTVSGRLRAYASEEPGSPPRRLRDMGRGDVIGEISLYTDAPRTATVVAVRDALLVRLDKADFLQLLEREPRAGVRLTREMVRRLQTEHRHAPDATPVMQALLPISDGVDAAGFAERLADALRRFGRVRLVDAAQVQAALGVAAEASRIAAWLDEIEAAHDLVLLLGDASPSAWTAQCARHADEVLLLARADASPALHPNEQGPREAAEVLVLLHAADAVSPRGSAAWLARRPVADHLHIRPQLDRDMARLARLQARQGVGLVLAGGGARGFSHLGLVQSLQAQGVEVDCVGGTSMGALMATLVASDQPLERVLTLTRDGFRINPTGDIAWLPLLSLIKGQRLRRALQAALGSLLQQDVAQADLADLWKNCFVVATNYSQAREELRHHGPLAKLLRASTAIPGALPPVVMDGDLLCDGGSFNNFPVDAMRNRRGIRLVLGADLSVHKPRRLDFDELPGTWALLRDRLRPRKARRYKLPSLAAYLLNVTILYSSSRRRQAQAACDVYFNPPLERVGLLDWKQFDRIVQQGRAHADEVLARPDVQTLLKSP